MKLYSFLTISVALMALACCHKSNAQTVTIRTESYEKGFFIYTEVFEYDYVDEKPEFPGGSQSLLNFVNDNREYPKEAYKNGIEGRVTCSFVVNTDGKLSHLKILRGVEPSLNKEALRIISKMPDWKPGIINNEPVPVRVIYSIPFRK